MTAAAPAEYRRSRPLRGPVSDVMTKPVYGGSALADYAIESTPAIATLRPGAFAAAGAGGSPEIVAVDVGAPAARVRVVAPRR